MNTEIQSKLMMPFRSHEIAFRVGREFGDNASVLAYITARGIMNRLDAVLGVTGWWDEYEIVDKGVICKLTCCIDGQPITKIDAAPFTNIESLKGGFSDALKRAAVKFGVGRYLYDLPEMWVDLLPKRPEKGKNYIHSHKNKSGKYVYWVDPVMPKWALPDSNDVSDNEDDSPDAVTFANKDCLRACLRRYKESGKLTTEEIITLNKHFLGVADAKECFNAEKIITYINFCCDLEDPVPAAKLDPESRDMIIEGRLLIEYNHEKGINAARLKYPDPAILLEHLREKRLTKILKAGRYNSDGTINKTKPEQQEADNV